MVETTEGAEEELVLKTRDEGFTSDGLPRFKSWMGVLSTQTRNVPLLVVGDHFVLGRFLCRVRPVPRKMYPVPVSSRLSVRSTG